ncbi:integrase core domain-containing protein, partial [Corynebacterium striatum]
ATPADRGAANINYERKPLAVPGTWNPGTNYADSRYQLPQIDNSDHGSQYVSIIYNERLAEHEIIASTGTVGDSYDNALAENVNGSYKNELIHTRLWTDVVDVEIATFEWVNWWNESRLHQSLGYRTPAEVEADFWEHHPSREIMENKAQA